MFRFINIGFSSIFITYSCRTFTFKNVAVYYTNSIFNIYEVVIFICLFVCHEPLNRFVSNLNMEIWETHKNILRLGFRIYVEWVDLQKEKNAKIVIYHQARVNGGSTFISTYRYDYSSFTFIWTETFLILDIETNAQSPFFVILNIILISSNVWMKSCYWWVCY